MSARIKKEYESFNKDEVYGEIQSRRADREGKEGANQFEGINSSTPKDEMVAALEKDDEGEDPDPGNKPPREAGAGKSKDKAGVGNPEAPENQPIPDSVKIPRKVVSEEGMKTTANASVVGNQSLLVIDIRQSRPVDVFLIDAKPFRKDLPADPLVFVQGAVSSELLPYKNALSRFACKKDGTVIYNPTGFDDVPGNVEFDMVDIVKLIQHNHGETPKEGPGLQ